MSKALKAFRRFRNNLRWLEENTSLKSYFENDELHFKEDFDIIETALKNYEELTNTPVIFYGRTHGYTQALTDYICKNYKKVKIINLEDEKKLKVLEVIKEKEVDIHNFKEFIIKQEWTYEQYLDEENDTNTSGHQFAYKLLTQEEYALLKEVLL